MLAKYTILIAILTLALAENNAGFDHRAHAVPGPDITVYDLDGNGEESVQLNALGSHSHFFEPGPPVKSGTIVSYLWSYLETGQKICNNINCRTSFPVGITSVRLTVVDNTGDVASDNLLVTVLPRSLASKSPFISSVSPNQGTSNGGDRITIDGNFLYRDSQVFFGPKKVSNVQYVNLGRIVCFAPPASGTVSVKVVSSIGTSNLVSYSYHRGSNVAIRFIEDTWKKADGSEFPAPDISSITIGPDHRYYLGSLVGYVTAVSISRSLVVTSSCKGAHMGDNRSITGIAHNPKDISKTLYVSTNTHFHSKHNSRWDNGRVEAVTLASNGCPVRGPTIISGLPVSNHDHGVNAIAFLADGRMLVSIGSFSNAGASKPGDRLGGFPENPLSASVVVADYLARGFDGNVKYDQYHRPGSSVIVSGDVKTYAVGIRNCFGMVRHSNGEVYATDNGPNKGFGPQSVTCSSTGSEPATGDKLLRLIQGAYYGHPNRNRGRKNGIECRYRSIEEPSGNGYVQAIGTVRSSTDGIIEYRANTFRAGMKGDLILSKIAFRSRGIIWRAQLNADGKSIRSDPFQLFDDSGLSLTMGLYGELIMPQLRRNRVLTLRPNQSASRTVEVINVHPQRGLSSGGTDLLITGSFLNLRDVVILVGGKVCSNIRNASFDQLRCTSPAGRGKVSVVAIAEGVSSTSYGHEFEYV